MTTAAASIAARSARRLQAIQRRQNMASEAWQWIQIHGQGLSVDKLLCRPSLAKKMCTYVRKRPPFKDAQEHEICEALLAARKDGKCQIERRTTKATKSAKQ